MIYAKIITLVVLVPLLVICCARPWFALAGWIWSTLVKPMEGER